MGKYANVNLSTEEQPIYYAVSTQFMKHTIHRAEDTISNGANKNHNNNVIAINVKRIFKLEPIEGRNGIRNFTMCIHGVTSCLLVKSIYIEYCWICLWSPNRGIPLQAA